MTQVSVPNGPITNYVYTTTNTTGAPAQTQTPGENPTVGANGILISGGTTEVTMPKANVDDGGLSNTVPASIVSGGVDPGRTAARDGNAVTEAAGAMDADLLAEYEGFGAMSMNVGLQGGAKEFYVDPLILDLNGDGVKLTDYGSNPVLSTPTMTDWWNKRGGFLRKTGLLLLIGMPMGRLTIFPRCFPSIMVGRWELADRQGRGLLRMGLRL